MIPGREQARSPAHNAYSLDAHSRPEKPSGPCGMEKSPISAMLPGGLGGPEPLVVRRCVEIVENVDRLQHELLNRMPFQ